VNGLVNRYREEYATAERANKVKIAAAVIAAVQNIGGRFVRESNAASDGGGRSSWYVVTHDRAVEKTCKYYYCISCYTLFFLMLTLFFCYTLSQTPFDVYRSGKPKRGMAISFLLLLHSVD
jgi:hypothetical protein